MRFPLRAILRPSTLVFSFGSSEKGQIGNGSTGERITTGNKVAFDIIDTPCASCLYSYPHTHPPAGTDYVKELNGKKVVQIASGQQHSAAVDDEGYASNPSWIASLITHQYLAMSMFGDIMVIVD